jgi:hypothetical protein
MDVFLRIVDALKAPRGDPAVDDIVSIDAQWPIASDQRPASSTRPRKGDIQLRGPRQSRVSPLGNNRGRVQQ